MARNHFQSHQLDQWSKTPLKIASKKQRFGSQYVYGHLTKDLPDQLLKTREFSFILAPAGGSKALRAQR